MKRRIKKPQPIMTECADCEGAGTVQADCANCGVALTTSNQADAGSEGLLEDCCKKCWKEDTQYTERAGRAK
jgi:thymidine kinase